MNRSTITEAIDVAHRLVGITIGGYQSEAAHDPNTLGGVAMIFQLDVVKLRDYVTNDHEHTAGMVGASISAARLAYLITELCGKADHYRAINAIAVAARDLVEECLFLYDRAEREKG